MPDAPFTVLHLVSPHAHGDEVEAAQRALKDNRFQNFHPGKVNGRYNEETASAARRAKYWLGFPKKKWIGEPRFDYSHKLHLQLTGEKKLGPIQRRRRTHRLNRDKGGPGMDALEMAHTQLGTKESPPDSNNVKYNTWYYGHPVNGSQYAWCAVFVSWCFANSVPFYKLRKPSFKYAYVPFVVANARSGKSGLQVVARSGVRRGDLVCFDWEGDGIADHIGFFNGWINQTSGTFKTIEGNTSLTDQSNGGEVMARERTISQVRVFARVSAVGDVQ